MANKPEVMEAPKPVMVESPKTKEQEYAEMVAALRANRPTTVTIDLPHPNDNEERAIFAGVNGKHMLIPRGKPLQVPYEIAQVIRDSQKSDFQARIKRDALQDAASKF